MRSVLKHTRLLAAGAAAVLALAACGTQPEEEAAPAPVETTEAPAPAPTTPDAPTPTETDDHMQAETDDPFALLKQAADHVGPGGSSQAIAGAVATAAGLEGDVSSEAAGLHAVLSSLLQEHVYLAGIAVDIGLSFGLDSPEFEAAAATLDTNSVELADLIGSVAPDQRDAFLELWRQHIGFFVDYAAGAAGGDEDAKQQALDNLDGYRAQAGAFFEDITGGELPADAVASELEGHIGTLAAAIDALAAGLVQ